MTLLINDVAATGGTPSCTINTGSTGCATPISGNWVVDAGDTVSLSVVQASGTGSTTSTANASVTLIPAHYVSLASSCASTSPSACDDATVTSAGTLTSAGITLAGNVPAGNSYTVTVFKNGAPTGSTCTVAASTNSCTISGGLAVAATDTLEVSVRRATGTTAFTAAVATTTAVVTSPTITAPAVSTTQTNDVVVRVFGTGAGTPGFASGNGLAQAFVGNSTATGMDDAAQPGVGTTGPASVDGASPDNWVGQTIALREDRTSITVNRPATRVSGDFLLVSITAEGLNGGSICAPDLTWTQVTSGTAAGSPNLTQTTFSKIVNDATTPSWDFTFTDGANCTGHPASVAASAVSVRYTGVHAAAPVDVSGSGTTPGSNPGTTLTAPSVTTTHSLDQVVRFYGSGDGTLNNGTIAFSQAGASTVTGVEDAAGGAAGGTGTATATSSSSALWVGQTVTLTNDAGSRRSRSRRMPSQAICCSSR